MPPLEMPSFSLRRKRLAAEEDSAHNPAPWEPRVSRQLPAIALSGIPAATLTGVVGDDEDSEVETPEPHDVR